jgi:hypothetical protein
MVERLGAVGINTRMRLGYEPTTISAAGEAFDL